MRAVLYDFHFRKHASLLRPCKTQSAKPYKVTVGRRSKSCFANFLGRISSPDLCSEGAGRLPSFRSDDDQEFTVRQRRERDRRKRLVPEGNRGDIILHRQPSPVVTPADRLDVDA